MPRLSTKDYLTTRSSLRDVRGWMYDLDPDDVLAVARFFAPTKPFTDAEALAHRRTVAASDPSLPNRVGKILKKPRTASLPGEREIARAVGVPEPGPTLIGPKGREKPLRVVPVRRATADLHKLARVIELDMRKPVGERAVDRLRQRDQGAAA